MILKASQRSGGANLAAHLMNDRDNDHVRIHDMRGFVADDLRGAFKEARAISLGTKCKQYLFSLSLSPPETESVAVGVFEDAIERIEQKLGLTDQPRAIVFHEKEGRRHAHCVWSRIDAQTMTAKQMSYFQTKLMEVSRELYLENGWKMPSGLANAAERDPTNFTLAEWQQAKRQNIDPRWLKQTLQECWNGSDNAKAFARSLEDKGFFLAKGDRRGHVILDHNGEVWSLSRMLNVTAKDVRARLGEGNDLASVTDTQKRIGEKMTPALRRHIAESRLQFQQRSATLGHAKVQMTQVHRDARDKQRQHQDREWNAETVQRAARLPKGLRGLWHRITGQYQQTRKLNEFEAELSRQRQEKEREKLVQSQLEERRTLQLQFKDLRQRQAQQLLALRSDIGRYLKFSRGLEAAREPSRGAVTGLGLSL